MELEHPACVSLPIIRRVCQEKSWLNVNHCCINESTGRLIGPWNNLEALKNFAKNAIEMMTMFRKAWSDCLEIPPNFFWKIPSMIVSEIRSRSTPTIFHGMLQSILPKLRQVILQQSNFNAHIWCIRCIWHRISTGIQKFLQRSSSTSATKYFSCFRKSLKMFTRLFPGNPQRFIKMQ